MSAWQLYGFAACRETVSLPAADLHRMLVYLPVLEDVAIESPLFRA
jgi:hypothetical protein